MLMVPPVMVAPANKFRGPAGAALGCVIVLAVAVLLQLIVLCVFSISFEHGGGAMALVTVDDAHFTPGRDRVSE
jgi:hypothetical protein